MCPPAPPQLSSRREGSLIVDFRYHLVSIIAVFLALALGIVVGTTALNGALLDSLKGSIETLTTDKRQLESTISTLREQVANDEVLAERVAPAAVQDRLAGRRVLLVAAPDAAGSLVDGLVPLLEAAGATVTTTVRLRPDLLDPTKQSDLDALVRRVAPAGVDLSAATPTARAAAELAAALMAPVPEDGLRAEVASAVLTAYVEDDLLDLTGEPGAPAELAVVVVGSPSGSPTGSQDSDQVARTEALLTFAAALDVAGSGAVVAGPIEATEPGGALQALQDDSRLSQRVSSVDGIDRPQGRLAVVYALQEQRRGGTGRYGTGPASQGPLPSLSPR